MSRSPCKFPPLSKLIHILSSYLSSLSDEVNHKSLGEAFTKTLSKIKFSLKSNLKMFIQNIQMPIKQPARPIDALRDLFEDQQLQLNDLSQIIKTQSEKIKRLEDKNKELLKKESEPKSSGSWFFA